MKTNMKKTVFSVALIGLTAGAMSWAADSPKDYNAPSTADEMPARCNRASSLIGMDVRNQNNEHLGHVKDVVFDFKSGRVSYVVMTTAPKDVPELHEKLLAVPLDAFTAGPDDKHLILNADKTRVDSAAGFNEHDWPALDNPTRGTEQFWNKTSDTTPGMSPNQQPIQNR